MSRRAKVFTGELAAVATVYVPGTNRIDLGDAEERHRLRVLARSSEAGGKFGYLVVSQKVLSDADAITALGAAASRVRFFAGELAGPAGFLDVSFDSGFRYVYFLAENGTIDLSVIAEQE